MSPHSFRNCSDLRGSESLKGENRGRIPVADAHADGYQTAFAQLDSPSLNSYQFSAGIALVSPNHYTRAPSAISELSLT